MWSGVVSRDPGVTTRILTRRPRLPGSRLVVSFSLMASPATSAARAQDDDRHVQLLDQLPIARRAPVEQISRRTGAQHDIIDNLVAALRAGGHALLASV